MVGTTDDQNIIFPYFSRKFMKNATCNKLIFSQYDSFHKYKYFFSQSIFWSLFNHRQKCQSNQDQHILCCSCPCFRVLLCTHFGLTAGLTKGASVEKLHRELGFEKLCLKRGLDHLYHYCKFWKNIKIIPESIGNI